MRVVHASSIAPAVTVTSALPGGPRNGTGGAGVPAASGVTLAQGLSFPNTSEYVPVPSGAQTLVVREVESQNIIIEVPGFILVPGAVYTFYLVADAVDNQLKVITAVDAGMAWRLP